MKYRYSFFYFLLTINAGYSQVISAGSNHSVFLCNGGSVQVTGNNYYGQLGISSIPWQTNSPLSISNLADVVQVSSTYSSTFFLLNNNTVAACGSNSGGELGDGTYTNRPIPTLIPNLTNVVKIANGVAHTLFLKQDARVYSCGTNANGELALGISNTNSNQPVLISNLQNVVDIAAGQTHSLFLKSDGKVWASGFNLYGGLGDGTNINKNVAIEIPSLNSIVKISGGSGYSVFLKNDGTVWCSGYNYFGQLGTGNNSNSNVSVQVTSLNNIIEISSITFHTLFLKNDGTVWACGNNDHGQLGDGTLVNKNIPIQIASLNNIVAIEAGATHSLFLKNDGSVWACGRNSGGQLGDGTTIDKLVPVQVLNLCSVNPLSTIQFDVRHLISLYPNPNRGVFFFKNIENENAEILDVTIYNTLGKIIFTRNHLTENIEINISSQSKGIYFYKLSDGDKVIKVGKLIIK